MKKISSSIYYLQELRYRLGYVFAGALLLFVTTYKYKQALVYVIVPKGLSYFVAAGLTEIFFTYIQICKLFSLNFGAILIMAQTYLFLRPGLYSYESKTIITFIVGAACFYTSTYVLLFPPLSEIVWEMFSVYSRDFTPIHLTFEPRLSDYLMHIKQVNKMLILSFPYLLCLNWAQRYTTRQLWVQYRGVLYVAAFFTAALVTPPDLLSQVLVGLPLIILYEIQIVLWSLYREYKIKLSIGQPIEALKNTLSNEKK